MYELLPISSPEAERSVVGSCILSPEALGTVSEMVKPEDIYDLNLRVLYKIIIEMYAAGKIVDIITVQDEAKKRNVFERIGGQPFIAEILNSVTTTAIVGSHAEIVQEKALRRRMEEAGKKIAKIARKPDIVSSEIVSKAEKAILDASQNRESSSPVSLPDLSGTVTQEIAEMYKAGGRKLTGYSSGLMDLDKLILGFQPGSLNIIAARPSMGKTALALNIAQFGGETDKNSCVLIFSLEMSARQLMYRMYSAQSGVKLSNIASGIMSEDEYIKLMESAEILSKRNIFIQDTSELSAMDFRTQCRRFKTRHPDLALIVVDYLQLMSSGSKRSDNRQYEVAEISRVMKSVAAELECPVIALSQLSRETEKRTDKKPQLADLRDSGAIEQDADTVIMLYREDYYSETENNNMMDSKADLRVAKNRNGSTGVCHLTFRREYTRFMNYAV